MSSIQNIWNPETGITDIDGDWQDLSATEVASIRKIWKDQQERLKGTRQLTQFTERMSREWAIETGIIENLYQIDRGITHTLIERGFHAEFLTHGSTDKPTSYVINLLRDQQDALDGVFAFIKQDRPLTSSYIKELHGALVRSQDTTEGVDAHGNLIQIPLLKGDWKKQPNYPSRDGVVFAYCSPEQVASEIDRLVELHQAHTEEGVAPEVEAAWLHHRFSQIHPFQDGNGRVSRALASLVLIRSGLFPLVVTRDEKDKYLDSLEAADKGNLKPLVSLSASLQTAQFRKATALSENILAAGADVASIMSSLKKTAQKSREERELDQQGVFGHAKLLEERTQSALEALVPELRQVLQTINHDGNAFVRRSVQSNSYFYWGQIIENANSMNLNYYVDTQSYRSWVSLNLAWERKARLVFAFHGIGRPFTGSLVCAPFMEFRDSDDEQIHSTVVPVADEAFVFFYTENQQNLEQRFDDWRDKVVAVALKQLEGSL